MKPWEILDRTQAPDGTELTLVRHTSEYVIRAGGHVLMSSRMHSSEDALATLGCRRARTLARPRVLIGGLGMGFTLRAALDCLPPGARLVVAELVPAVVEWNRGPLADFAARPLDDPRVRVEDGDVASIVRSSVAGFDAILLDVDNGPAALTLASNARLYDQRGVAALRAALAPGGVLAFWSASDDPAFERRLRTAGFTVEREGVRAHKGRGTRHSVLLASLAKGSAREPMHR
jgi:spermidine synthase